MAPFRQFLRFAKPWQRMVLGVVLTVVGLFTGLYVVTAIGIVLVVLPVVGWFKRRGGGAAAANGDEPHDGATSEAPDGRCRRASD